MLIKIKPVPKPRMTRSDKWKKRPAVLRYWQFCDELRSKCGALALGNRARIIFFIGMPTKTWSKKKRAEMAGKPHDQKPDVDNMIKGIFDALFKDDSKIYSIFAEKYWAEEDAIDLEFY
jgi:Holliday junction resolvase RusA-like endonuclease